MRSLARSTVGVAAWQVTNNVVAYIATLLLIRHTTEEGYAAFALAINSVGLVAGLADAGISVLLVRELAAPAGPDGVRRSAGALLGTGLALKGILAVVAFGALELIVEFGKFEPTSAWLARLCGIGLIISGRLPGFRTMLEGFHRSRERFVRPVLLAGAIDTLAIAAALVAFGPFFPATRDGSARAAMLCYALPPLIGFCWLLVATRRSIRDEGERLRVDAPNMLRLARTALPLAVALLFWSLHVYLDSLLLRWWATERDVGVYNAALRVLAASAFIPVSIGLVIAPRIASLRGNPGAADALARRGLTAVLTLATLVAIVVAVWPDALLRIGIGKFADARDALVWVMWSYLPAAVGTVFVEVTVARGAESINVLYCALLAGATFAADALLIPKYGAAGAGAARCVAITLAVGISLTAAARRGAVSGRTVGMIARGGIAALLAVGVTLAPINPFARCLGAMAACIGASLAMRITTPSEIRLLAGALRPRRREK
jgi:O-antigen/teichoic acid export membrane protein